MSIHCNLTHVKIYEHLKRGVFVPICVLVTRETVFQIHAPLHLIISDNIGMRYKWQTKNQAITMLFTTTFAVVGILNLIKFVDALVRLRVDIEDESTELVSHNMTNVLIVNKYEKN